MNSLFFIKALVHIKDNRSNFTLDKLAVLKQLNMELIASYSEDSSAYILRQNPAEVF